jgi:hypothetical protein
MNRINNMRMSPAPTVFRADGHISTSDMIVAKLRLLEMRPGDVREFNRGLRRDVGFAVLRMRTKCPNWQFSIRARRSDGEVGYVERLR